VRERGREQGSEIRKGVVEGGRQLRSEGERKKGKGVRAGVSKGEKE
jgi:hypothetical protein